MANYTRNDFIKSLIAIEDSIKSKGGSVLKENANPSPFELNSGVKSIPQLFIQGPTGYAIAVAELDGVTFELSKNGSVVETKTTPSPNGGLVVLNPTEIGIHTITASNSDGVKWTKEVDVENIGLLSVLSPLKLAGYSLSEIKTIFSNNYGKYMFEEGDYIDAGSFMGSTTEANRKLYLRGFDDCVNKYGHTIEGTFGFEMTPSTYKMANSNLNGLSYIGSLIYDLLSPLGTEKYTWDNTVTSSTSGIYYVWDNVLQTFEEKTLPDEFTANTKYYQKTTLSSDGAIWNGVPEEIRNIATESKQLTWGGYGAGVTNLTTAKNDDTMIVTYGKLFNPSAYQYFGEPYLGGQSSGYWAYKYGATAEGKQFSGFKKKFPLSEMPSQTLWFRSPSLYGSSSFCGWYGSYGYVSGVSAPYSYRVPMCLCIGQDD